MVNSLSIIQSQKVLEAYQTLPYVCELTVTKAGFFPTIQGHKTVRELGIDEYILIYCIDGAGWVGDFSHTNEIQKGDIIVINPHTPHTYGALNEMPWSILWVHFTGKQADFLVNQFRSPTDCFITKIGYQPQLIDLFHTLISTFDTEVNLLMMLRSTTYLQHLLCEMITRESVSYKQNSHFKDIRQVIGFMKNNLSRKLTLEDLSEVAHLSKYHFLRKFKDYTSHTPLEYFNSLKIKKACELLETSDLNISEISEVLGFSTPYYFSECFKHLTGYAPTQYKSLILTKF